jgi:RNA polymerase primary sigma factor
MILAAIDPRFSKFLDQAASHPILSASEERALIILAQQGNQAARRRLCACNLKFVITLARAFRSYGLPMADLIQEGAKGLDTAIDRYSLESRFKFISYAVWWVRQAMNAAINTTSRTIRITSEHEAPIRKVKRLPLQQAIGGEYVDDVETVARQARIPPKNLLAGLRAASAGQGNPDTDWAIASEAPRPDDHTHGNERIAILNRLRGKLPPVQRRIITLSFGLDDRQPLTYREIGYQLNISHERVRQLRNEALAKMRALAERYRE